MQRDQFGPYRVIRLLGQGGMGAVYEAVDPATGRKVAIKTLPLHLASDEGIRRRFQAEIKTLMTLSHPGVARMLAWGEEDDLPFFAMELVPGLTLDALLKSGRRFTARETVAIAREIVRVLKAAHDHGVVHRDLKPANLMFPPAPGGGFHVKLTDFGISKLYGETGLTRSGTVVGTPEYMAPEQASGGMVDHRADLYSLGLVMYAMLAGKPPFQGGMAEVLDSQRSRRPPSIATLVPDVPKPLDDLIDRLLEKHPGRRPANATVVDRMLADIAAAPVSPPHHTASPTTADPSPTAVTVPPVPSAMATTVYTDGAFHPPSSAKPPDHRDTESRIPQSSFTTVEEAARLTRERKARTARFTTWLNALAALAIVSAVLAGGYLLLRPLIWPTADEIHREILGILEDPHALADPCRPIASFLRSFPRDPRAADVRGLGREIGLERLWKRLRRRVRVGQFKPLTNPPATDEEAFLEALRLWLVDNNPSQAAAMFKELIGKNAAAKPPANATPCDVALQPDPAAWRELAARQFGIVKKLADAKDAAENQANRLDVRRAAAMLEEAAELHAATQASPDAMRRVIAVTRRHDLLNDVVEDYAEKPHCAEQVAEARRLLDADR